MSSKSGLKSKESFESWESLFRKTLSKDRLLNFPRPAENPIQWIHLLDSFDHQETRSSLKSTASREGLVAGESSPKSGDKLSHLKFPEAVVALAQAAAKASGESRTTGSMDLSGWPVVPFSKVQMFKCEKCCLEFCSPVNHRRHLRVIHRRAVHTEKEDLRSLRQQLATFWDSLSLEEISKIVDVRSLVLEDLAGEKVVKALSHLLQQPALFALPHSYVKSGAMLVELVQCRSSKLRLSSSELFKILDGSSEKTFPSFGLSAMQRYVFEGGAGKVGLEAKNLVSSLGFLVELNLVKAFIKDKDEEAWRCQAALVEEEEASQRKRAQIQERKRLKKARQKDSKEKDLKPSDHTMAFLSAGSDLSDEEEELANAKLDAGYDLQSRPSSNAFENLYNRLAGEGIDSDLHQNAVSTLMLSPLESNHLTDEPVEADVSNLCSQAVPTVVSSALHESSAHGSTKSIASGDIARSEHSEHEAVECAANDVSNEGSTPAASGFKKLHVKEKAKCLVERSADGRDLVAPFKKSSWKEGQNLSFRKFPRHMVATNANEGVDLMCSQVALENTPANKVPGFRVNQLMGKSERGKKYFATAQAGTAIWTKKASKHSDATCDLSSVHTNLANGTNTGVPDHGAPEARAEVPTVDSSYESMATCSNSPFSTTENCKLYQQSNLAAMDGGFCSLDNHFSATSASHGNEVDQAGNILPSLSSMVVGSVVIGSLSILLEGPMADQDERGLQSNTLSAEAEGRCMFEASQRDSAGPSHLAGKLEESLRELNENGAVNCVPHKGPERSGKSLKLSSQLDVEEKENHEHLPHVAAEGKSSRSTFMQAGTPKGGQAKVWRPVVSTTFHEFQDRQASVGSANENVVTNQGSRVAGKEANNSASVDAEEHEEGQSILEDSVLGANEITSADEGEITSAKEGVKIESNVAEEVNIYPPTYETVCLFLSRRWSSAVDALDTVVLCLEDNEECESQSRGLSEDWHAKDLRNPSLQGNKDAVSLPGHGKTIRGFWKQGCSSSAMVASRRLSGKNNFNVAPRFGGYRYVPK